MGEVARRGFDVAWRLAAGLPDGPVELWLVVTDVTGSPLGAAEVDPDPGWYWSAGVFCVRYREVEIPFLAAGVPVGAYLAAVSRPAGRWVPVLPVPLVVPGDPFLRVHDSLTLSDGRIGFRPLRGGDRTFSKVGRD